MNPQKDIPSLLRKGVSLQQSGRRAEARQVYDEILAVDPQNPDALHLLGLMALDAGEPLLAEDLVRKAIIADSAAPLFHLNLANALSVQGKGEEAADSLYTALSLDPLLPEAHFNLANEFFRAGRATRAICHYKIAIKIRHSAPEFHYNLGKALEAVDELSEAEAAYRDALTLRPDYREAIHNLAVVLYDQNRTDESVEHCHRLLSSGGQDIDAIIQMSLSLLKAGRLAEGFRLYEARLHKPDAAYLKSAMPRWNGEALPEGTLLVRAEQGLGDVLQFVRYLPYVKQRAGRVILECQPSLVRLLRQLPWTDLVVSRKADLSTPDVQADAQIPLLSLAGLLETTVAGIPSDIPYLQPSFESVVKWKTRLRDYGDKRKIGVVWSGNKGKDKTDRRAAPLAMFECLMENREVVFFSLQKGEASAELRNVRFGDRIVDLTPSIADFEDTAGLVAHLDLVICIDTSVAHLAGAMGRPVWVLLPYSADWRWLIGRGDSPWYPTMKLFRQPRPGDWTAVFRGVQTAMEKRGI